MTIVTRFAPSPTGFLHLGHAYSAWSSWRRGGQFLLRLEDIDSGRCRPEFAAAIAEDLQWLGLNWTGDVRVQSAHFPEYRAALERLAAMDLLYPCFCTRADIASAAAAPHGNALIYPGTCRHLDEPTRAAKIAGGSAYALRIKIDAALKKATTPLRFFEEREGWIEAALAAHGDIVLARKDAPASYHLCVVHDDALQGVTHVIRGEDLRAATGLHVLLQALLKLPTPIYAHHRLITDQAGRRLAKRDGAPTLRSLRAAGQTATAILRQFEEWHTA